MNPGDVIRQKGCDPTGTVITVTRGGRYVYVRLANGAVARWWTSQCERVEADE